MVGVGSAGTLTGLTRFFQRVQPDLEIVLADPVGSVLAEYSRSGTLGHARLVGGRRHRRGFHSVDRRPVQRAPRLFDQRRGELRPRPRVAASAEGILGGSSTGTLLAAALRYCREQTEPKRVVTFVCDTGTRYLSKVYNDQWMIDQGLLQRKRYGDLRDLIARRFDDGRVISVGPDDTLLTAFQRMRLADVSQLPVLVERQATGRRDRRIRPAAARARRRRALSLDRWPAR